LVFTSAGDKSNLHHWLKGERNFDLWISYYGDKENNYLDLSDYYIARKGGKFPNFYYIHQKWGDILNNYQAIIIMDDDIIIDALAISRLFEIREQYDLWILQPSFDVRGKISHPITKVKPLSFLRYTNFVEITCPLFRKDKLDEFMRVYDPVLVGWGIDWWFLDLLVHGNRDKVAIIDEVSCINPHDRQKGQQREIDRLQDTPTRMKTWENIKAKHNIQGRDFLEYNSVKKEFNYSNFIQAVNISVMLFFYNCMKLFRYCRRKIRQKITS